MATFPGLSLLASISSGKNGSKQRYDYKLTGVETCREGVFVSMGREAEEVVG